jgi:Protein of unknown function (DUF3089)
MLNWKEVKHINVFYNMLVAMAFVSITGCSAIKNLQMDANEHTALPIDYSRLENWAAHPEKKDPSDTIPKSLTENTEKEVNVFFIHPTTYTGKMKTGRENATIIDQKINDKTDASAIRFQASVFNENSNVYAPRYRQAHISMYKEKDSLYLKSKFGLAYTDVKNAFQVFLKHQNGRPFIIASHSQGTTHAKLLIKEMIEGTPLQEKLIVAYLIGMPVEKNYFDEIKPCTDSIQTNCFVSWRTFRKDYNDSWASRIDTSIVVVNPITWKSNSEIIPEEKHMGAILYNMNKIYKGTHQTQVEGSGLWISKPKFPGSFLYRTKNYHVGDINLFYLDIRNNIKQRIRTYQQIQDHHLK